MKLSNIFKYLTLIVCQIVFAQNNWEALSGPNGGDFHSIVCVNDKLYAGTDAAGMVFQSTDYGMTWKKSKHANEEINYITANETGLLIAGKTGGMFIGDTLYSINDQSAIFRSTNGGSQWFYLRSYNNGTGKFITVDDSGSFYIITNEDIGKIRNYGYGDESIYYFGNFTTKINSLIFNPDHSVYLAVDGTFKKSTDYGASWTTTNVGVSEIKRLIISEQYGILASTTNGIFQSTNKGETWKSIGLSGHTVNECAVDSKGSIYASTWIGIFKCTNINNPQWSILPATSMNIFDFDKDSNGTLYAATMKGLRYSNDHGMTWKFVEKGYYEMVAITVDHKGHLIFGTLGLGRYSLPLDEKSVIDTFVQTRIGGWIWGTTDLAVTSNNTIYASTYPHIMKSTDDGKTWIIDTPYNATGSFALGLTVTDDDDVYIAYSVMGVLFKNSYNQWEARNNGIESKNVQSIVSDQTGRLYCGNWNGLWYSDNKGISWQMKENDSLKGKWIGKLERNNRGDIFAATSTGIYATGDRGLHWKFLGSIDMELGFFNMPFASIFPVSDDTLFIGGYDQTLYRCVLSPNSLNVHTLPSSKPENYSLSQNYPNPFNGATNIQYSIPTNSKVKLKVFDILGKEISSLVDESLPPGIYHVRWNANVSSGMYFLRIESQSIDQPNNIYSATKKMQLIR